MQGESQSPIVPVPQRRDEIEADEEIIVVMDRVVEPVPRWVLSTLLVQFLLQVVLGPEFDGAFHALRPFRCRIHRERAHALPRIHIQTTPKTTPTAILVPIRHNPLERAANRGKDTVTELHDCAPGPS